MQETEKGVTLIALVITIIILLILAGVSVTTLTGEKSIINQATNTGSSAQRESIIEKIEADLLKEKMKTGDTPTKNELKAIIEQNGYNEGTLGDNSFVTKDGGYTINYDEIIGWEDYITIDDLKVGDKVYYDTGNTNVGDNGIIECVVLYDKAYNEAKGTNYGIQIISSDVIKNSEGTAVTVPLGYNDNTVDGSDNFEKAKNSYNNALKRLYEEAQKYLNETYAISARCVGSDPADPDWDTTTNEAGYFTKTEGENGYYAYMKDYYGILKDTDDKYNTDWTQMGTITGIKPASDYYWVASRYVYSNSNGSYLFSSNFCVRVVNTSGDLSNNIFCYVYSRGDAHGTSNSYGFRPIFTLNSGIKITEGDGVDIPYTLKN